MTDEQAVIEYRDEDTGTVFRWHGGAYIDVGYVTMMADVPMNVGPYPALGFEATTVINVWDDELDISTLERQVQAEGERNRRPFRRILELFEERCRRYLSEAMAEEDV